MRQKKSLLRKEIGFGFLEWLAILFAVMLGQILPMSIFLFSDTLHREMRAVEDISTTALESKVEEFALSNTHDNVIYAASWVILFLISIAAVAQIREILKSREHDVPRKRANQIALIIALALIVFLFKQPFLDMLFAERTAGYWMQTMLFGGGATAGWSVWYLRQLTRYGEFFNVLLMALVVGLCWYARLTAPEEVQLTAAAFLLTSLFRVAKDYLDSPAVQRPPA
ncbi:MAG: hypothetical protein GY856_18570 [bacterium]|nr:hypothetical protein [bacterium]